MKIYLAGPLFTAAEREFNSGLRNALVEIGYDVFLPQDDCSLAVSKHNTDWNCLFDICKNAIYESDVVIANLDGADCDSGTCYEVGFARGLGKYIIGYRTDIRNGEYALNVMLRNGVHNMLYIPALELDIVISRVCKELDKDIRNQEI